MRACSPGVSIGATLAAARRRAGLTVSEVSQRTRVRENIIRGIEQDDYAACGGDFYARGHIRAIAGAVGEDPGPLIEEFDSTWGSARELTAAEAFRPVMPIRTRERRRVRWTAVLAVLVLAVLGFAGYKFAAGLGRAQRTGAVAASHSRAPRTAPAGGGLAQSAAGSTPAVRTRSSETPSPASTPSPAPAPPRPLTPAGVTAFGPGGAGTGDDPQHAALALGGDPARPWLSDWYTTARFGNLQAGTGLLVDMGRTVTVTSVQVSLGGGPGADLELRAGGTPALAALPPVARSDGAGGTVRFRLGTPARARYLLVWFTLLPPDSAGTYQASVWKIAVQGRPLPSRHGP
jgi:cytoskeletal protein RodZ